MESSEQVRYCTQCGAGNAAQANFCASCGNQLEATHGPSFTQAEPTFDYRDNQPHSQIVREQQESPDGGTEEAVKFKKLHPNARWLFFFSYMQKTAILPLLFAIGAGTWAFLGEEFYALISAAAIVVYVLAHFIAAVVAYRHYSFQVTETSFRKEYGILHIQTASIPFERIQNVNIRRNLIDRFLGLSHVDIETAGTGGQRKNPVIGGSKSRAEGHVPGIAPQEAEDVRDLIMKRAQQYAPAPPTNP